MCCIVSNFFRSETLEYFVKSDEFEMLIVRVKYKEFHAIIVNLYFPHGSSLNLNQFNSVCNHIINSVDCHLKSFPLCKVVLLGDFNHFKTDIFLSSFCLRNLVQQPTRKDAILDLILIPEEHVQFYLSCIILPPLSTSDHNIVLLKSKCTLVSDDYFVKVYDFRESNLLPALIYLSSVDWSCNLLNCDLDQMCHLFYFYLEASLNMLPIDYVNRSIKDPPWMTNVVKVLINKRYKAYRSKDWHLYHHYKEKVKTAIYEAKKGWGNRMLTEGKSVWDVYKWVKGDQNAMSNWLPNCDPDKSVECILEDIRKTLHSSFVTQTASSSTFRPYPFTVPFQVNEAELNDLLQHVNPKKSPGSDDIPSKVWSLFATHLAEPLTIIFNSCLQHADLPKKWKTAYVTPLPKSTPPTLNSLRPISLLPMPARLFEKCLLKRMKHEFLTKFDNSQFAYRPRSSTVCALIALEDYLTTHLDDPEVLACHIMSIDLLKGFDRIPHDLLIAKMINDEFNGFTITFTQNYITDRKFKVKWKGISSSSSDVPSGIPQGSSFGPILFGYFIADLFLPSHDSLLLKYADDIIAADVIRKKDSTSNLFSVYDEIIKWTFQNGMSVKEEKCQQMIVQRVASISTSPFTVANIPMKEDMRILGVLLDRNMKWKLHIQQICKRASSRLYILRQLRDYLPPSELTVVYQNCIRGLLEYGAPLFVDLPRTLVDKLEQIQNRAHFIICNAHHCECAKFTPLEYRRKIIGFKLFQKIMANIDHPLYHLIPSVLPYSGKLRLPISKSAQRSRCFISSMTRLYNSDFCL